MQTNTAAIPTPATTFLRLPQVREIAGGVAPSTIWGWVKKGEFPKPIKLSPNCTAWDAQAVEAWAQARLAAAHDYTSNNKS